MSSDPVDQLLADIDDRTPIGKLTDRSKTRPSPYVDAIRASSLFVDRTYQRDLDNRRVGVMVSQYDRTLLGVLEVSARQSGRFAIIEGQHRWAAARLAEANDVLLVCQIHRGMTVEEESKLFYDIDTKRRALSGWDRWKARRSSGDSKVAEIERILATFGLRVDPAPKDGHVGATGALEKVYIAGREPLLTSVLTVLTQAYGSSRDAFDSTIIQGTGQVMAAYRIGIELDPDRLIAALQGIVPRQIKARAAALREAHRSELGRLTAAVMVDRYNSLPGKKVAEFMVHMAPGARNTIKSKRPQT